MELQVIIGYICYGLFGAVVLCLGIDKWLGPEDR